MRYLPKSDAERQSMLREIGASSIDDLFSSIPAEYRLARDLDIPRQMGESEIVDFFKNARPRMPTATSVSSARAPIATIVRWLSMHSFSVVSSSPPTRPISRRSRRAPSRRSSNSRP